MARLTDVFMGSYTELRQRRIPIYIDDSISLIMQMDEEFLFGNEFLEPTKAELKEFSKKFNLIPRDPSGSERSLKVGPDMFMAALHRMVPCLGCRRSAELLYQTAVEFQFPAFFPFVLEDDGSLSLWQAHFKPKFLCRLFHGQNPRGKVQALMDTLSKCNRRCALHCLDSQRIKSVSSWVDIWESMDVDCQEETVVIEMSYLKETLSRYLSKHRFCAECKSKVQRAYKILVEELDKDDEPGYAPGVYEGITCLTDIGHLQLSASTDFISRLIAKAVPEIVGKKRREKHAKTMQIAQEEVLTCLGVCLFERLHRIHQRFREEERAWELVMCASIQALRWKFEEIVESKRGISQLELFCEELNKEEQLKLQKLETKKQRRRRKKEKKSEECAQEEEEDEPTDLPCEENGVNETANPEETEEAPPAEVTVTKKKKKRSGKSKKSKSNAETLKIPAAGGEEFKPQELCQNGGDSTENVPDCGYSSENIVDLPYSASSEGSEISCSDGCCNHNGDCSTSSVGSRGKRSPPLKDCPSRPRSTSFLYPMPYRTLEEQLEDNYSSDEEEICIPEEEKCLVLTQSWGEKREEFRRQLLVDYNNACGVALTAAFKRRPDDPEQKSDFEENIPPEAEPPNTQTSEMKGNSKGETYRSKPRAPAQASRRYKGKNRR